MKYNKLFALFAVAALAVSCNEEILDETPAAGFLGVIDSDYASWNAGDQILVTGSGSTGVFASKSSGTKSTFEKVSGDDMLSGARTAYYPADLLENMTVPTVQTLAAGTAQKEPMIASSNSAVLLFKPLLSHLQVNLTTGTAVSVKSLKINADKALSGAYDIENLAACGSGTEGLVLDCGSGLEISGSTVSALFTVLPVEVSELAFEIVTSDGAVLKKEYNGLKMKAEAGKTVIFDLPLSDMTYNVATLKSGAEANAAIAAENGGLPLKKIVFEASSDKTYKVELQDDLKSNTKVWYSFDPASGTGTISFNAGILYAPENMDRLFDGFSSLETIENLHLLTTGHSTTMNSLFRGCTSLKNLDLSGFSTQNVTSMKSVFNGCESLESVNLTSLNTAEVTALDSMFCNCKALKQADFSRFNVQKVKTMKAMFAFSGFETIDVSSFDTFALKDASYMFYKCEQLKYLDFRNLYTIGLSTKCTYFIVGDVNLAEIWFGGNFYGATLSHFAGEKTDPYETRVGSVPGTIKIYCGVTTKDALIKTTLKVIHNGDTGVKAIPIYIYNHRSLGEFAINW